jgi:hypothetical protein
MVAGRSDRGSAELQVNAIVDATGLPEVLPLYVRVRTLV